MPIAREILDMFEFGRKRSQVILVVFLDRKWQTLQRISFPLCDGMRFLDFHGYRWPHCIESSLCGYTPLYGHHREISVESKGYQVCLSDAAHGYVKQLQFPLCLYVQSVQPLATTCGTLSIVNVTLD